MKKRIICLFMISFIAIFLTFSNKKFTMLILILMEVQQLPAVEVKKGETLEESDCSY